MIKNKTWFRIHSFTGVITGLLLFVICWSGTFAVVSHELDWLVTPQARSAHALPEGHLLDWQSVYVAAKTAHPEGTLGWIEKPLYAKSNAEVIMNLPHQEYVRVYVDPVSFEVLGTYSYINVQRFFRSFHMNLFIPGRVGSYIVMLFGVTLFISGVAALYFYRRWWQRFFRINWAGNIWSELHKAVGLWSIWFIFVIAITGCWYLFELMRGHLGDGHFAFTGNGDYAVHPLPPPTADASLSPLPLGDLVAKVHALRPDLDIRQVSYQSAADDANALFYADGQSRHWLVRDRANQVVLDSRNGELLYSQEASEYPLYWRWSDTADPLHFGNFGGLVSKLIWFIFGLALSGIILTGTWLHVKRLMRERRGRRRSSWPGTVPAVVASLMVLVASAPFGVRSMRDYYGIYENGHNVLPELALGVSVVITLWLVSTLLIIGLWCLWLVKPASAPVTDAGGANPNIAPDYGHRTPPPQATPPGR